MWVFLRRIKFKFPNLYFKVSDIQISKTLSWLLRHGAPKEGIPISEGGFACAANILEHKSLKGKCTLERLKRLVSSDGKQRYSLRVNTDGVLEIKANQGHSIEVLDLN